MADRPEALRLIKSVRDARGGGEAPTVAKPPEYSDMGNARRFVAQHGDELRYCAELRNHPCQGWLAYEQTGAPQPGEHDEEGPRRVVQTGGRWTTDDTGERTRRAKRTVESIEKENEKLGLGADIAEQFKHYQASQQSGKITAMVHLAECELPIPCTTKEFDKDPMLLNIRNGTIDLSSQEFYSARRTDMLRKQAPVEYDALATAPSWMMFNQRAFARDPNNWQESGGKDEELMAYIARVAGYCLTGLAREKAFFLCYGLPDTGKGTFVETLLALLGEDYAIVTATESLTEAKGFTQHPADIAAMQAKRLIVVTETGRSLNINKLKQLTGGGDTIAARGMRENWRQVKPTWKVMLQTNQFPNTSDSGFYKRLNLVPFDSIIPKGQQEPKLKEILQTELSGILNWALAGLKDYLEGGLRPPARMVEAGVSLRAEVDDVSRFRGECCREAPTLVISKEALYSKYLWWCEFREMLPANSRSRMSKRTFGRVMKESGFDEGHSDNERYWRGLDVLPPASSVTGGGRAEKHPLDEDRIRAELDRVANESDLFR